MIDISQYGLLTPADSTLSLDVDGDIKIHYRNGEIITIDNNESIDIDLTKIKGVQADEFNLTFKNHDEQFIKNCQRSEDWLYALYYMFNFVVNENWVLCCE